MKIREVSEQQINAALQEIESRIAEIIKRLEKLEAAITNK
jgi:hypothetical protein